ncbi:uncharacterized protein LOC126837901 [Adelges cooleyi]|uniref:uncharacterized protein LOC126837901 n=1 Tax=Adelges cooleyi TaxID=133065 RepID=UPI00217FED2E|nr:uncharacterized protein LOC126837901 [Adelges cooleyi]
MFDVKKMLNVDLTTAPNSVLMDGDLIESYDCQLDASCDADCELSCRTTVPEIDRLTAFRKFRQMADVRIAQNAFICASVEVHPRDTAVAADSDADGLYCDDLTDYRTVDYWLGDQIKLKVCKTFFAGTLAVPGSRLDAVLKPETYQWFRKHLVTTSYSAGQQLQMVQGDAADNMSDEALTDFVLESRKQLDKDYGAFVEECDSDADVNMSSVYQKVVAHIQSVPRVISSWKDLDGGDSKTVYFETSVDYTEMYANYMINSAGDRKTVSLKQYKKIYNNYMKNVFMRPSLHV